MQPPTYLCTVQKISKDLSLLPYRTVVRRTITIIPITTLDHMLSIPKLQSFVFRWGWDNQLNGVTTCESLDANMDNAPKEPGPDNKPKEPGPLESRGFSLNRCAKVDLR